MGWFWRRKRPEVDLEVDETVAKMEALRMAAELSELAQQIREKALKLQKEIAREQRII